MKLVTEWIVTSHIWETLLTITTLPFSLLAHFVSVLPRKRLVFCLRVFEFFISKKLSTNRKKCQTYGFPYLHRINKIKLNYLWYILLFRVCKIIHFSEGFAKISQKIWTVDEKHINSCQYKHAWNIWHICKLKSLVKYPDLFFNTSWSFWIRSYTFQKYFWIVLGCNLYLNCYNENGKSK